MGVLYASGDIGKEVNAAYNMRTLFTLKMQCYNVLVCMRRQYGDAKGEHSGSI